MTKTLLVCWGVIAGALLFRVAFRIWFFVNAPRRR